jgi:hypothetical protein
MSRTLEADLRELSVRRARRAARRSPDAIVSGAVAWVLATYVGLIVGSPYWDDDKINRSIRTYLKVNHETLFGFIWLQVKGVVHSWDRFFPVGQTWVYVVFDVFDKRVSYKLLVGLVLVFALVVVAACVAHVAGGWVPAAAFVLLAATALQMRLWADGVAAFAGIVALTTGMSFGALLIVLFRPGRWWALLAAIIYSAALLSYEVVVVFAPVMILIIIVVRRSWRPTIAIAIPAVLELLVTLTLHVLEPQTLNPEYQVSLDPGAVISTFGKQMVAALPLSQWWVTHVPNLPPIGGSLILGSIALIGLPVFVGMRRLATADWTPSRRALAVIAVTGAWMWIGPSILIAITKRWQESMPLGEGYISVVYEYFGFALVALALWAYVLSRLRARGADSAVRAWGLGSAAAVALVATLTMAGDLSLLSVT